MKQKRLTFTSALRLALFALCVILCSNTVSFGQIINADCFTLTASSNQTANCGPQNSDCGTCDNCKTFDMTNISQNCDITQITITCNEDDVCWSTCCPAVYGSPDITACTVNTVNGVTGKKYTGHFGPTPLMPPPGIAKFTICYQGTGPHTFKIHESGSAAWGAGAADCCNTDATVRF